MCVSRRPFGPLVCLFGFAASLLLLAGPATAQTDTLRTMPRALALIRSEQYDLAILMLEAITEREPDNAQAWMFLGYALHSSGDIDRAIPAHLKAAEFEATAPAASYNVGLAYALKGETDSAFEWLFRARDSGKVDVTQIAFDPDAANLRDDERYAQLFPSAEDLADPFLEDVETLQEWRGDEVGGEFGWIARNIGDVDGDSVNDVATSAPSSSSNGANAGKIYVFSGKSGDPLWSLAGQPGDRLGLGIEAAGDVNADDVPDVIVGAPGAGKAYVYSGADGSLLVTLYERHTDEWFGRKVSDLGDVNIDLHADVVVGAPQNDAAGDDAGRIYIFSGRDGGLLLTLDGEAAGDRFGSAVAGYYDGTHMLLVVGAPNAGPGHGGRVYVYHDLSGRPAFTIEADETGAALGGMFVSVVGDVNADGMPDVYASDWPNNARGRSTGRAYVHSGADGRLLHTFTGEAAGDGFGIGTADAGDVDDDGHDDLIIGAWQHAGAAAAGGKVYLYSGRDGSLITTYTSKVPGETFGFDATGLGDVDGDGALDFLVTSAWSSVNGPRSGRVYVLSGRMEESSEP